MLTGRSGRPAAGNAPHDASRPDWKVDVDIDSLTTFFSHTNPGETIVGHPVRITLENPGVVWVVTNRFCRMGGPFAEVLIETRWPD